MIIAGIATRFTKSIKGSHPYSPTARLALNRLQDFYTQSPCLSVDLNLGPLWFLSLLIQIIHLEPHGQVICQQSGCYKDIQRPVRKNIIPIVKLFVDLRQALLQTSNDTINGLGSCDDRSYLSNPTGGCKW